MKLFLACHNLISFHFKLKREFFLFLPAFVLSITNCPFLLQLEGLSDVLLDMLVDSDSITVQKSSVLITLGSEKKNSKKK